MSLPLIDLAGSPDPGRAMDEALRATGFMQVRHAGISDELLARVFAESAAFFDGPRAVKERCRYRSAAENFGWQGLLDENLDPQAPADLKESFTMRNIVHGPPPEERWPSATFRETMREFFAAALSAAHAMQRLLAPRLGVPEEFFAGVHNGECVSLRLLYYPASLDIAPAEGQMGAGAHTDYGFLTLLFQDDVGGLQLRGADGTWLDVTPLPGTAVVNSGDLLERWTNLAYRSTPHRVVAPLGRRDRFSIAMFIDPDWETQVAVLPSCTRPDNPARFEPVTAGEHITQKLAASHKGRFDG